MKAQKNSPEIYHELPQNFPHTAPEGYKYEAVCFKRNVIAIRSVYDSGFVYSDYLPVRCIWGFYNTKTGEYSAPINATKQGNTVNVEHTTPYSAMQLNLNPLERAFL
jgi:hypothetical protein